jgi:chaperonin GroES
MKAPSNKVIIKPDPKVEKAGSIWLPPRRVQRSQYGTVLVVGDGVAEVAEGQRVLIGRYVGQEMTLDGERLLLLREVDIMGVVE